MKRGLRSTSALCRGRASSLPWDCRRVYEKQSDKIKSALANVENQLPSTNVAPNVNSQNRALNKVRQQSTPIKVNTQALLEYAQKQRVFIVSPTSILAYLHLVLSGIKAFKVEEGAKQIQKKVEDLGLAIARVKAKKLQKA